MESSNSTLCRSSVGTSCQGCNDNEAFLSVVPTVVSAVGRVRNCCSINVTDLVVCCVAVPGRVVQLHESTPRISHHILVGHLVRRQVLSTAVPESIARRTRPPRRKIFLEGRQTSHCGHRAEVGRYLGGDWCVEANLAPAWYHA